MANSQFFAPAPSAKAEATSQIIESNDITDLLKYIGDGKKKILVLDIDNTSAEPEEQHEELGSDQWFVCFLNHARSINLSEGIDVAVFVIAIYHAVQHHVQLKLIQPEVISIIQQYAEAGIPTVFLTARGPEICEPTLHQLKRNGVDLTSQWGDDKTLLDIGDGDTQHAPVFKRGAIFCGGKPKEKCLKAFLQDRKPDIVIADDKRKYAEAVIKMASEYGGKVTALHYRRMDEKVKNHNFEKAQRKLHEMSPQLSPQAQEAMAALGMKM